MSCECLWCDIRTSTVGPEKKTCPLFFGSCIEFGNDDVDDRK